MGLFDKINLLHIFMFIVFIIGILLIIITFEAYSKLTQQCSSNSLKNKLQISIIIGTVFAITSIGYFICVMKKSCKCNIGLKASWQLYTFVVISTGMGVGLLLLSNGIKNDLKQPNCNINLNYIPDILFGLSIAQIIMSVLYFVWIIYSGAPQGSKKPPIEEDSDEVKSIRALAEEATILENEKSSRTQKINELKSELTKLKQSENSYTLRGKKAPDNIRKSIKEKSSQIARESTRVAEMDKKLTNISSLMSGGSSEQSDSGSTASSLLSTSSKEIKKIDDDDEDITIP